MGLGTDTLNIGDWIVHAYYGIGQVQGTDTKTLNEDKQTYYKIKTNDSIYWLPTDNLDADHIRPVASLYKIRKAISELKGNPIEMERDYKLRNKRIRETFDEGTVVSFAQLLRDLYWRKFTNHLNEKEKDTLLTLKERISREWALAGEMELPEASQKLDSILTLDIAVKLKADSQKGVNP